MLKSIPNTLKEHTDGVFYQEICILAVDTLHPDYRLLSSSKLKALKLINKPFLGPNPQKKALEDKIIENLVEQRIKVIDHFDAYLKFKRYLACTLWLCLLAELGLRIAILCHIPLLLFKGFPEIVALGLLFITMLPLKRYHKKLKVAQSLNATRYSDVFKTTISYRLANPFIWVSSVLAVIEFCLYKLLDGFFPRINSKDKKLDAPPSSYLALILKTPVYLIIHALNYLIEYILVPICNWIIDKLMPLLKCCGRCRSLCFGQTNEEEMISNEMNNFPENNNPSKPRPSSNSLSLTYNNQNHSNHNFKRHSATISSHLNKLGITTFNPLPTLGPANSCPATINELTQSPKSKDHLNTHTITQSLPDVSHFTTEINLSIIKD